MKKIKYIVGLLLILFTFIFISELYVWHIDSFEADYPYTTMFLQKDSSHEKMLTDILTAMEEHSVDIFVVEKEIETLFSEKIVIYATDGAISTVENKSNIISGSFRSILLGKIDVMILPFEDIPNLETVDTYRVIGTEGDIIAFKQSLVNSYAGRYPQFPTVSNETKYFIIVVWLIVFSLLLLFTLYEISYLKKEIMIRVISGENINHIVVKNIIADIIYYNFILFIGIMILNQYMNIQYFVQTTIIMASAFGVVNSLLYLKIYQVNYKRDIVTNASTRGALRASYILKVSTLVLLTIAIAGNIGMIMTGINFYKQSTFFEEHREHSYLTISTEDFDETFSINRDLYKYASREKKAISLVNLGKWESEVEYILANSGAINYLEQILSGLDLENAKEEIYFIIPESMMQKELVLEEMLEVWESYFTGEYSYKIIPYKEKADIIAVENIGKIRSELLHNPIVILDNMSVESIDEYWNIGYIANSTLYDYSADEWEKFVGNLEYENILSYKTNVYNNYIYQWEIVKRNMYAGIILMLLLLVLEGIVIRTIVRFEYSVNAMELALKRVLGYSLYERHKKIILLTYILSVLGVVTSMIVSYIFDLVPILDILIGGIILILLENVFITWSVYKVEQRSIQRILKGEKI